MFTFLKKGNVFSAYGREGVKMNFIDRIFVGELTSTIMCEECENVGILEFNLLWKQSINDLNIPCFEINPYCLSHSCFSHI